MAVRVLIEVGLDFLATLAFLNRIPESKIQSCGRGIIRRGHRSTGSGVHRFLHSGAGERSKGALRILVEIGFQLGWTAVLDAVPKCQFEGDFIVS